MDQFSKERTAYPVAQLACIVNQLHRLALIMPEAKFPSGMTVSQLSTLGTCPSCETEKMSTSEILKPFSSCAVPPSAVY